MESEERNTEAEDAPDRERDPAAPIEPRGNPDTDDAAVEQGKAKLDQISGN
jgi:hypothetical protein